VGQDISFKNLQSPTINAGRSSWDLNSLCTTTRATSLIEWLDRNSKSKTLWPFAMVSNCCTIEFNSFKGLDTFVGNRYLGVEKSEPQLSDVLIVAGSITCKSADMLLEIYKLMPSPKWVLCFGACASSGGPYEMEHIVQGVSKLFPVDVYVPGCPPTPEGLINGLLKLRERILLGVRAEEE